jgi:type II secretory pathway component PulK
MRRRRKPAALIGVFVAVAVAVAVANGWIG